MAIVNTCVYDAWAAYDDRAIGTQLDAALRRPPSERTETNKKKAISYAAYRSLSDIFPAYSDSIFKPLMRQLGYDPNDNSTDIETPQGIGNVACAAVLEYRHHDNANQLGDLSPSGKQDAGPKPNPNGPFGDWTSYVPVNSSGTLPARATFTKPLNPDHWQPLTYTDSSGSLIVQMFSDAHWGFVTPFVALREASGLHELHDKKTTDAETLRQTLGSLPAKFGSPEYQHQAEELVTLSASLTDEQKLLCEFWSEAPDSDKPADHWLQFAQFVVDRDRLSLDDQVKLFFVLSNAMMDADIAAYDSKRYYDSVRPATAIPLLFRGKKIKAWAGPGKGIAEIDGEQWLPYQPATFPTPPSPEYVSEVSAESAVAAAILKVFTNSDRFGYSVRFEKGSTKIEPGLSPARDITLNWPSFTDAADQAGMSGRYGGIQFAAGDLAGRKLGRLNAERVWSKAQSYFDGTHSAPARKLKHATGN